jgi:hypothetical protein
MAKRSTAGLVKYVKFLMEAGVMERPMWLNALERYANLILHHKLFTKHVI